MTREFILEIFSAAAMQRWNDKIRPVELKELDKQAHKMIIAWVLGRFEAESGAPVDWIRLIEGAGDHDIDAKVPGFGKMQLKSSVVKKV